MKLTYLGTGSTNSFLDPDGVCRDGPDPQKRDERRPCCMLIEDNLLINLPEGLFSEPCGFLPISRSVRYILVPHAHSGHFSVRELFSPACPGGVTVLCSEKTERFIRAELDRAGLELPAGVGFLRLKPYTAVRAGEFTLIPLKARRETGEVFIHIVECGGKRLLCANDTGFFPEETWDFLSGRVFDGVSFDMKNFGRSDSTDHMTLEDNVTAKKRLYQLGCTHSGTRFISTHFPQDDRLTYEAIHERLSLYGMTAAYDGMTVNL